MEPALTTGDRLLCRSVKAGRLRVGDIVALRDPRDHARTIVKRIHAIDGAMAEVRGDNSTASTDSRTFGRIPIDAIEGRVIRTYTS